MEKDNAKAEALFAKSKVGNDDPDPVYDEIDVQFKEIPDTTIFSNNRNGDAFPEMKSLFITRNALGVTDTTV